MIRVPILRLGPGLLTLASALAPGLAAAGGPDEVSLIARDDRPMQAWATAEDFPHDAVVSSRPRLAGVERTAASPYPAIVEHPRTERPTPGSVWVSGFWRWDSAEKDFAWVPGRWVTPPPDSFWVDGSWKRDDRGWYRVPGFWSARKSSQATAHGPVASTTESAGGFSSVAPAARVSPPPATTSTTRPVALTQFNTPGPVGGEVQPLPLPNPGVPAAGLPEAGTGVVASPQVDESAVAAPAVAAPAVAVAPSVVALADQLAGQAAAFEQVFGRTARVTPGGGSFLAEARQIRGAALGLRQAAASGDAYQTSLAYRQINYAWQRMAARVNQIAPGRTGPNIQQIWSMGATAAEIGRSVP